VGIYSGEMSERKVGYRLDTLIGHIPNGSLVHGNASIQSEYKQFIQELPNMFSGSIKVLTPNMINGPADVNSLRVFIEKEGLDILFVDQLSLLEDQRHGKTPVEKAANISRDLKNLQVLKRVPIVSVSQQNRTKNEGGVIDTTQIAQSDRIGQDSTCIIFLEKDDDIIKLNLVKSRDSVNGKVLSYLVDFNRGEFTFIPEEVEGEQPQQTQAEADNSNKYGKEYTGDETF
jgi:replicative DNA helicase